MAMTLTRSQQSTATRVVSLLLLFDHLASERSARAAKKKRMMTAKSREVKCPRHSSL